MGGVGDRPAVVVAREGGTVRERNKVCMGQSEEKKKENRTGPKKQYIFLII
jgi:hypothetical protein